MLVKCPNHQKSLADTTSRIAQHYYGIAMSSSLIYDIFHANKLTSSVNIVLADMNTLVTDSHGGELLMRKMLLNMQR